MSSGPGVYPSSTATTDYDAAIEKARKAQEKSEAMRQAQINNFKPAKDLSELEAQLSQSKWNNLFSMDEKAMGSGSNTTGSQFVCYRAITEELQLPYEFDADMEEFGITNEIWEIAGTLVNNSLELECYIEMLRKGIRAGDIDPSHKLWPDPGSQLSHLGRKLLLPMIPNFPSLKRFTNRPDGYFQIISRSHPRLSFLAIKKAHLPRKSRWLGSILTRLISCSVLLQATPL